MSDTTAGGVWDLYRNVPRVQQTAELHAAGFAYGGLVAAVHQPYGDATMRVRAAPPALEEIGLHLFVAGRAQARLRVEADAIHVESGEGCEFSWGEGQVARLARSTTGVPLWELDAATQEMLLGSTLPAELLDPAAARTLDYMAITLPLVTYAANVEEMKLRFTHGLQQCLAGIRVLRWEWDPPLRLPGHQPPFNLGHVYQVFAGKGLRLERVRHEALDAVDARARAGVIAMSTAREVTESFATRV